MSPMLSDHWDCLYAYCQRILDIYARKISSYNTELCNLERISFVCVLRCEEAFSHFFTKMKLAVKFDSDYACSKFWEDIRTA